MLLDKELIIEIRPYTKVKLDGQVVEGSEKESPMSLPIVLVQADKLELAGNSVKQVYSATAVGPRTGSHGKLHGKLLPWCSYHFWGSTINYLVVELGLLLISLDNR